LFERLYEYVFNTSYQFRSKEVFGTIDRVSKNWTIPETYDARSNFVGFLEGLLHRQSKIFAEQQSLKETTADPEEESKSSALANAETSTFWISLKVEQCRIRSAIAIVMQNVLPEVSDEE